MKKICYWVGIGYYPRSKSSNGNRYIYLYIYLDDHEEDGDEGTVSE